MSTYLLPIAGVICAVLFIALCTPRSGTSRTQEKRAARQTKDGLAPGETLESLTAELENAVAQAVRELDIVQPYIMREGWAGLDPEERNQRQVFRRRYISALEAWRKAEECADFDGSNGNIDLRMIGSIPLVRKAGIMKAQQSIQKSREIQNDLGLNS